MNRKNGIAGQPLLMLVLGIAALALRKRLYTVAVDPRGLLLRNHPLEIGLLVLSGAALLGILWMVRKADLSEMPGVQSWAAAVGSVAAGAGVLVTVLTGAPMMGNYLEILWRYLGLAAPVCFLLAGMARALGKKPFFLLHVVPCLFFLAHIVSRYQLWSSNPQMQDYVFALLGAAALMLFAFYTAAMEAECGNFRMKLGMGLAAIYLCTGELARSACPALYLGGILWVLTDLCGIRYVSEEKK